MSALLNQPTNTPPQAWSNSDKWWIAFALGLLFAILSSPFLYGITNIIIGQGLCIVPLYIGEGPTFLGLLIHTIIFILIVRLILA